MNLFAGNLVSFAAEEGPSPVVPHPSEIFVGVIAFGILLFLISRKVVPRFELIFSERTAAIEGGIAKAERAQEDAAKALAQYQAQLANARSEAQTIREEARVQGIAIIEDMRARALEETSRITAAAQASIETERQQAIIQLRNEVGKLATELASKIVGEALDDQVRQTRIIDRFLSDFEKSN
ncbi:MAG: F0F1 ATP synthase subunit B [Actinobacteria bacterium]|nr:F0F1 ATP synthase subunit B [Actinomycetota bacterium]